MINLIILSKTGDSHEAFTQRPIALVVKLGSVLLGDCL